MFAHNQENTNKTITSAITIQLSQIGLYDCTNNVWIIYPQAFASVQVQFA